MTVGSLRLAHGAGLIGILLTLGRVGVNRNSIKIEMQITTRQVKAARALLGWSQADLAQHSGVSEPTVARLESADGKLGGREDTAEKIRTAIEIAGVEFIDENGGGRGVRLRKRSRPRGQRSG
jgi:DNA-binding XRE family transcriptional regulator